MSDTTSILILQVQASIEELSETGEDLKQWTSLISTFKALA